MEHIHATQHSDQKVGCYGHLQRVCSLLPVPSVISQSGLISDITGKAAC